MIQLRVVQFCSEIIVVTNRMISDQIALHSVQLPLSVLSIYQLPGGLKNSYWVFILLSNAWYQVRFWLRVSLRKRLTFGDATTGFPAKWLLRNERRNSILMTRHYPNLGSASDWLCGVGNLIQPIRSTTQIWIVTRIEFLRSFFRRQLAGKPVVASPNVGCFLRLVKSMTYRLDYYEPELLPSKDSCLVSVRNKTGHERAAETSLLFFLVV